MEKLTVFAPAKVNLHLAVKNRRLDGFHNLESIFIAVDFGDFLHFEPINGKKTDEIVMEGLNPGKTGIIADSDNIIFKAHSKFKDKTGFDRAFKISVEKRIPIGGGLGGGSSNAAATLAALNKLAGFPLRREELFETGCVLGSDVPFFLHETAAAWVTGRGENIEPLEAPCLNLVLVNPGFPSDTGEAFKMLDKFRAEIDSRRLRTEGSMRLCEIKMCKKHFMNDFLPVFPEKEKSVYNKIISSLYELGAEFANLSGAGSTCFGVFNEREQAENAHKILSSCWDFVQVCGLYKKEANRIKD